MHGHNGHRPFRRTDARVRKQPAREQRLHQRNGRRKSPGDPDHLEAVCETRARPAILLRYPGQGQPGRRQRVPQGPFPGAVAAVIDGLWIGEIGKDLPRRVGDQIFVFYHGADFGQIARGEGMSAFTRVRDALTPAQGTPRPEPCAPISRILRR